MTDAMLTHDGITQPITEWALDYGIYPNVITDRLARGWSVDRAIITPMVTAPHQRLDHKHLPDLPTLRRVAKRLKATALSKGKGGSRPSIFVEFAGDRLSLQQWSERTGIAASTIRRRIKAGWPVQIALSAGCMSGKCRSGVAKNFAALEGTGGGSTAQDIPQIEFSK